MDYPAELLPNLPDDATHFLTRHHDHAHRQAQRRAIIRDDATRELGTLGLSWRETTELLSFAHEYATAAD